MIFNSSRLKNAKITMPISLNLYVYDNKYGIIVYNILQTLAQ